MIKFVQIALILHVAITSSLIANFTSMTAISSSIGLCQQYLNRAYEEGVYNYSLPQSILEEWLDGKGFPESPGHYTPEQYQGLCEDVCEIFQTILDANPSKEKIAIITAGAPGAGKTTKLHQDLESKKIAYIDPDDVCLKQMTRTYGKTIANGDGSKEARQAAYNLWRSGSNAVNHIILANLIRDKFAFYFGTTSTGAATKFFFKHLKEQGYQIRLIYVSAPDDVRWASIQERDKSFVQTTEADVKEKGLLLPQRILDAYLAYADVIEFNFRGGLHEDANLAATWIRNSEGSTRLGTLTIVDESKYKQIKEIHNLGVHTLNRPDLLWESTVEAEKNSVILNIQ